MSSEKWLAIGFAVLMVTSLVAMPALAGGPSPSSVDEHYSQQFAAGHSGGGPPGHGNSGPPAGDAGQTGPPGHERGSDALNVTVPELDANSSLETILVATERLEELDWNESESDAEAITETVTAINDSIQAYRQVDHVDNAAAFDSLSDAQAGLEELQTEFEENRSLLESTSADLYDVANASARLEVRDAAFTVEQYEEEFHNPGQRQSAESHLGNALDALERADDALEGDNSDTIEDRTRALNHLETAWGHAQKALDTVEANTDPDLSLSQGHAFEDDGTILVSVSIGVSDVRSYNYDEATVTVETADGETRTEQVSLYAPETSGATATGMTTVDVGEDAGNATVTVSATATHDDERSVEEALEIVVDEDDVIPELPDPDEYTEVEVEDDDSGVTVDAGGDGLHETHLEVTDRTPDTDDAYRAGPMVRIENTRAIDEATVTIPVDDADLEREGNLSVVTWDPHSDEPWVPVETEIDRDTGMATAEVEHFSFFSVFWIDDWEDHTSDTITLEDEHLEGNETDVGDGEFTKADVVFVVDESGSMSGSRIENAREGAIRFVGALTEDEQAGVVGFSAGSSLRHELSTDHASVNETIEGLSTGGGTNTAAGLSEGLAELERNGWENRSQVMILLADGHTNRGDDPVDVAREAADRGVEISTIGLGSSIDENELREIAGTTGGDFYQVEDADDLPDTFERVAENQTGVELTDTNDDGIPDVVAEMDLSMPAGEPGVVGEPLELDPIALDTSGDGLLDNETVDINYRVHEENNETKLTAQVTYAAHHPARIDTTGDGLTDREQLEGWEIEVVDDHDDASSMMAAVSDPDDDTNPARFFGTREVESNPLLSDTSGDGLTDVEELELGTDPKTTDTTGDGITDFEAVNRHDRHEDPTVFTTTAPSVNLLDYESGWVGDRFEFPRYTFQYQYQVEDAAGVSSSQLEQSGISGEYNTYHGPTSIVEFETIESESEGLLQWSRGVDTRITTEDIHGNDATRMFTVQRSVGSELAAEFPWLDDEDMGLVSGWTHGAAELPDTVLMLWRSPDETAEALSELAGEYAKTQVDDDPTSESEFWLEMARGMSDSVHFQQHTDNPHDPPVANPDDFFDACGDELAAHGEPQSDYCEFAAGWYQGYAVFIIAETVGGTSSLKAADSVEDVADAAETAGRNMDNVHWGSRMDGPTSKTSRINQQLVTDGGRDISRLLEDVPSEAAPQVQRAANTIPEERFQALSRSHEELGHFLNRHGTDGAETINRFDDPSNAHQLLAASPDDEIVTTIVQVTNNHDVAPGSLMEIVNRGHDITHVGKTLNNGAHGQWSPGTQGDRSRNFNDHYERHADGLNPEWDRTQYRQNAQELANQREGVEMYYQFSQENIATYDRTTNEFVTKNVDGEIQTYFAPDDPNYVDNLVDEGTAIRLDTGGT